ncbi:hypothetical protein D4Q76_01675 [archaeon]|nr:MAG: hypothetical protein D4Q76_01675 [archaeon]
MKDTKFISGIVLSIIGGILLISLNIILYAILLSISGFSIPLTFQNDILLSLAPSGIGQLGVSILFGILVIFGSIVSYKMNRKVGGLVVLVVSILSILLTFVSHVGGLGMLVYIIALNSLGLIGGIMILGRKK